MMELNLFVIDFLSDYDEFYYNIKKAFGKSISALVGSQMTNESKLNYFIKLNKAIEKLESI